MFKEGALLEHGNSEEQKQSVRLELPQQGPWLQKEIEKKAEVADQVLLQAFAAFYFIANEEISIMYILPLIEFLSVWGEGYALLYTSI